MTLLSHALDSHIRSVLTHALYLLSHTQSHTRSALSHALSLFTLIDFIKISNLRLCWLLIWKMDVEMNISRLLFGFYVCVSFFTTLHMALIHTPTHSLARVCLLFLSIFVIQIRVAHGQFFRKETNSSNGIKTIALSAVVCWLWYHDVMGVQLSVGCSIMTS